MWRNRTVHELERRHERERASWAVERANLLDRIMVLAGTPWTPPPSEPSWEPPADDEPIVTDGDQLIELDWTVSE